ncbi:MAG TPA: hypothetical protein VJI15_06285 [Candidatus Nanoarchaeia archaeon]|nr:hypothetical protein [Candidatus Nanoarchaeia archaeon]
MKHNNHHHGHTVSRRTSSYHVPLMVGLLSIAFLVALSVLVRFPSTGQAGLQNTPLLVPLDLDGEGEVLVDITVNPQWEIKVTASSGQALLLSVSTSSLQGIIKYQLLQDDDVLAAGLLNNMVSSSGNIYLDDDILPDMELRYSNGNFLARNINYKPPRATEFTLFDAQLRQIPSDSANISVRREQVFYINVSAAALPTVRGMFDDARLESPGSTPAQADGSSNIVINVREKQYTFDVYKSGEKYKLMRLAFTPTEAKAYRFTVSANNGITTESKVYSFAADGIVYELQDPHYPSMKMRLVPNVQHVEVDMEFPRSVELQPFSLPCSGSSSLSEFISHGNVARVYGYKRGVTQWLQGAASDLMEVRSGEGYVLKLSESVEPYHITFICSLDAVTLPTLVEGWNLIGVPGFSPVSPQQLSLPPNMEIVYVLELRRGVEHVPVDSLEPGKAYWIYVE